MKYLEMKIEIAPEMIESVLNELVVAGITDAVIDNPLEIAEMIAALGDTEWYDAEQVANDFLSCALNDDSADNADSIANANIGACATITVYCTADDEGLVRANAVRRIADAIHNADSNYHDEEDCSSVTITETWRDDSEWKDAWKEFYHTARVSRRFIVKPTWEAQPDSIYDVGIAPGLTGFIAEMESANAQGRQMESAKDPQELYVIEIDPGMAFGTGTHETTSLSMRMMEKYVKPGDKVLDVGTGSGILAIAAAKLGARDVLGIDIDEDAVRVANENLENNHSDNTARAIVGDLTEGIDYKADVVVANLLADLVMKLTSSVANHMADDAVYITSGILVDKQPEVAACLAENGFTIIDILEDGEWCSIAANKKDQ